MRGVPKRIISIHDVMPSTLAETASLLAYLEERRAGPVQLLVVPGLEWSPEDVARLKTWQDAGHELVGHGWTHKADAIRGLWHRLHSFFISRNVAEHLALDEEGIKSLLKANHQWFASQGLRAPSAYVPPAWALGSLPRTALAEQPFHTIETLNGLLMCPNGTRERQYLVGFEADTWLRMLTLRAFNAWNTAMARRHGKSLRVAIHPHDLSFRLAGDIKGYVENAGL